MQATVEPPLHLSVHYEVVHVKASSDYFTSRPATLGRIAIKHDYSRDTQCVK